VFRRCEGKANAHETPMGLVPAPEDLDLTRLELAPDALEQVLAIDDDALRAEVPLIRQHLAQFGPRLPSELQERLEDLARQLHNQ
jgi:phosphoenolpyruvate carboxykinase (GTP)